MTGLNDPCVSVVIVNYNAGDRLSRCLDCLSRQSFHDFEIIIIDNGSTDDSIQDAQNSDVPFTLIAVGENIGFAAANNRAARVARGDWIALLNPDAYPEPNWLEMMTAGIEAYPDVDAFGSTQLNAENPDRLDGAGDVCSVFGVAYRGGAGWPRQTIRGDWECFSPCAAAALYRKERFLSLGGFDERFFCYGEDVDFGFRLRLAGGRAILLGQAIVLHEGSGISGRTSDFTVYHGHRNRIWLFFKNMPLPLYLMTFPLRMLADGLLLIKAVIAGAGTSYIRAMRDGYGGLASFNEARKAGNRQRQLSGAKIARSLLWSPIKFVRRSVDLRPAGDRRQAL